MIISGLQRRTILILLMASFCGGLAIAYDQFFPTTTAIDSLDLSPLLDIAELQLVSFTIFLQGETLNFERSSMGNNWRMVTPENAPVSHHQVQQLLGLLGNHQPDKTFSVAAHQLEDYGLESPFASVLLRFSDGSRHHLAFGYSNFDQSKVYVQVNETTEVRVLSPILLEVINRQAADWLELEAIAEVMI